MRDSNVSEVKEHQQRRDVLKWLLSTWSIIVAAPGLKSLLEYVTPQKPQSSRAQILRIGSTTDLPRNSAKVFKVNKDPVIVVHTTTGQFKAFNARCTHLGCVVQFSPEETPPHFTCNCHGSEFDINGKNIVGPASRPLTPYRVIVRESNILVAKM